MEKKYAFNGFRRSADPRASDAEAVCHEKVSILYASYGMTETHERPGRRHVGMMLCAALFLASTPIVSGSETPCLDLIFETLARRHILTVGEAPGFTEQSGVIRFVIVDNELRLEINVAAAERAELRISSLLPRQSDVRREGSRA